MKQITPNSQTLEAITKHGATSMLWVIDEDIDETRIGWSIGVIKANLPLQVDDEFKIEHKVYSYATGIGKKYQYTERFKGKVLSVEVKRMQDLSYFEVQGLNGDYGFATKEKFYVWLKEQNIDYNSNPLVGLINFKEKG